MPAYSRNNCDDILHGFEAIGISKMACYTIINTQFVTHDISTHEDVGSRDVDQRLMRQTYRALTPSTLYNNNNIIILYINYYLFSFVS